MLNIYFTEENFLADCCAVLTLMLKRRWSHGMLMFLRHNHWLFLNVSWHCVWVDWGKSFELRILAYISSFYVKNARKILFSIINAVSGGWKIHLFKLMDQLYCRLWMCEFELKKEQRVFRSFSKDTRVGECEWEAGLCMYEREWKNRWEVPARVWVSRGRTEEKKSENLC